MTPLESAADLTESARLLSLFDSLAALELPTHAALSTAVFPLAADVLELWCSANEGTHYLDRYETAFGPCVALVRRVDCVALVHVYIGEIGRVQ